MQIVLNGQLKEWLNKHTETSFLLHPLVNAYYYCKRRIYTHTHTSRFFSLLFFVHRHTSTYKTEQNFHKMMMMQQRSNGRERNEKKRRILRSKNALIRKCCMHLSSLSMFYKHYRLPVLEARHLYVCTQVRDKTNKVKRRRERNKLLDVSLSLPYAFSLQLHNEEEKNSSAETDRFRYLYMEREMRDEENDQSIHIYIEM